MITFTVPETDITIPHWVIYAVGTWAIFSVINSILSIYHRILESRLLKLEHIDADVEKCVYKAGNQRKPFERHTSCGYWINYSNRTDWKYCPFCGDKIKEFSDD